mmetsp:Transcript_25669/g.67349  ORF Transcript_25669/g.67349 Transcript_25669/m.67349 type:complete len:201 (-) Transcript_25669:1433-2035(-)
MRSVVIAGVVTAIVVLWTLLGGTGSSWPVSLQTRRQASRPWTGVQRNDGISLVTLCSRCIFITAPDGAVLWRGGAAEWLTQLSNVFARRLVIFVEHCKSDATQDRISVVLGDLGVPIDRCVFCENSESIIHATRQLKPTVHIDSTAERAEFLAKHCDVVLLDEGWHRHGGAMADGHPLGAFRWAASLEEATTFVAHKTSS